MASLNFTGGEALQKRLKEIADKAGKGGTLRTGFLENATYPDGTPVAQVAAAQEYGAEIDHPGGTRYVIGADGMARFVPNDFVGPVSGVTKPHRIDIPARSFFRTMIEEKKAGWGKALGALAKDNDYDIDKALGLMGEGIKGQLQASIQAVTSPPLAASTVRAKGFDKPLVESGHMQNSVDYEVDT
jgi:hypothetical protein